MHRDPQTQAREMVPTVAHPVAGTVQTIGLPIKFQGTPGKVARPSPLFGQPTSEVLAELAYGRAEIDALGAAGAVTLGDNTSRAAAAIGRASCRARVGPSGWITGVPVNFK